MIRSALFILAGIVVAACFGCVPPPPHAGQPKPFATCDGTNLTNRIQFVQSGTVVTTEQLTSAMTSDLQLAYCQAPDVFRHHIDSVDYIYIDITGCQPVNGVMTCAPPSGEVGSWGMRVAGGYTQIGIPAGIWGATPWATPTSPAEQYTTFETAALQYLVPQRLGAYSNPNANLPYFAPATAGSPLSQSWMTVLAALAHELGHIRWYEVNDRSGYGQTYDFYRLNHCQVTTISNTSPGFFAGWANQTPAYLTYKKRWRNFGDTKIDNSNDHTEAPFLSNYVGLTSDAQKEQLVNELYSPSEPWASFLAANVPEEDFVETYKLDILMKAGLTSMPLTIPLGNGTSTTQEDIPGKLYNNGNPSLMPTLSDKMSCLKTVR